MISLHPRRSNVKTSSFFVRPKLHRSALFLGLTSYFYLGLLNSSEALHLCIRAGMSGSQTALTPVLARNLKCQFCIQPPMCPQNKSVIRKGRTEQAIKKIGFTERATPS